MKMDTYINQLNQNLKSFIQKGKYKSVISKTQIFMESQRNSMQDFSKHKIIHLLSLQCYSCHKVIMKNIIQQNDHINTHMLRQILKIMIRNLKFSYFLVSGCIEQENIFINCNIKNYSHQKNTKQMTHAMHFLDMQKKQINQKMWLEFIQISLFLAHDFMLIYCFKRQDQSKQNFINEIMKYINRISDLLIKKKINLRVMELKIKCMHFVYLFRLSKYSEGLQYCQSTLTQIFQLLSQMTLYCSSTNSFSEKKYTSAIGICHKLILLTLLYLVYFHILNNQLHLISFSLSLMKKIQQLSEPKKLLKCFFRYPQIMQNLQSIAEQYEELKCFIKEGQIFSIKSIHQIIKQFQNKKKIQCTLFSSSKFSNGQNIKSKNSKRAMRRSMANNINANQIKNSLAIYNKTQRSKKSNQQDDFFYKTDTYDSKRFKSVRSQFNFIEECQNQHDENEQKPMKVRTRNKKMTIQYSLNKKQNNFLDPPPKIKIEKKRKNNNLQGKRKINGFEQAINPDKIYKLGSRTNQNKIQKQTDFKKLLTKQPLLKQLINNKIVRFSQYLREQNVQKAKQQLVQKKTTKDTIQFQKMINNEMLEEQLLFQNSNNWQIFKSKIQNNIKQIYTSDNRQEKESFKLQQNYNLQQNEEKNLNQKQKEFKKARNSDQNKIMPTLQRFLKLLSRNKAHLQIQSFSIKIEQYLKKQQIVRIKQQQQIRQVKQNIMKSLFYKNGLLDSNLFNRTHRKFKFASMDHVSNTNIDWNSYKSQTSKKNGLKRMLSQNINHSNKQFIHKKQSLNQKKLCATRYTQNFLTKIGSITSHIEQKNISRTQRNKKYVKRYDHQNVVIPNGMSTQQFQQKLQASYQKSIQSITNVTKKIMVDQDLKANPKKLKKNIRKSLSFLPN